MQAAIDSGTRTVYLPGGSRFYFNGEVRIAGPTERIIGLEGRCEFGENAVWRLADSKDTPQSRDAPVVIIERCMSQSGGRSVKILHEPNRTLIVSSWIGAHVVGLGSGETFLDDVAGRLDLESPQHKAWCRQLNTEHQGTMLTKNGGSLWILGMKTEKNGTIIHTKNGGFTELQGCFIYTNRGWNNEIPAFLIEDSTANLCGLNERNYNLKPCRFWFHEIVNGVEKSQTERAWVYLSNEAD